MRVETHWGMKCCAGLERREVATTIDNVTCRISRRMAWISKSSNAVQATIVVAYATGLGI